MPHSQTSLTLRGENVGDFFQFVRDHAGEIEQIIEAHKFRDPQLIDYDDPKFDLTLLITPTNRPTLRDMGAIMNEFEDRWRVKVMLVTPNALTPQDRELVRPLRAAKAPGHSRPT
jgi:hypothetical protein